MRKSQEQEPLVTIMLCCYNHEKYVNEAMEAILNQSYRNLQILITDDGSMDNSREIIKSYQDDRIQLYLSEENTSFAIMEEAYSDIKGKYLCSVSMDDLFGEKVVETYVHFMETYTEYAICFSVPIIINDANRKNVDIFKKTFSNRFEAFHELFLYGNCICGPTVFIRTDVWTELGKFKWNYRQLQDYELWMQIFQKYDVYFFKEGEQEIYYHILSDSLSAPSRETVLRSYVECAIIRLDIMKKIEEDFFLQAFQNELVYKSDSDKYNFECEKFNVMYQYVMTSDISKVLYYYDLVNNYHLIEPLEKDYHFKKEKIWSVSYLPDLFLCVENIIKEECDQLNAFYKKCRNIYLYGAGKIGTRTLDILRKVGVMPKGFVVSHGHREEAIIEGLPVYVIDELVEINDNFDNVGIIVAVAEQYKNAVIDVIKRYSIENYIWMDHYLFTEYHMASKKLPFA